MISQSSVVVLILCKPSKLINQLAALATVRCPGQMMSQVVQVTYS